MAATPVLVGHFSLVEISSFEACRLKIHLLDTLFRQRLRAQAGVSSVATDDLGALPLKTPPKGAHTLWKPIICTVASRAINYNLFIAHHQFANKVGISKRVLNRHTLDEQCLCVENFAVSLELFLVAFIK